MTNKEVKVDEYVSDLEVFKSQITGKMQSKGKKVSKWIIKQIELEKISSENYLKKMQHVKRLHPIRPFRGEIYMAEMGENVGVEFNQYHPVLILQNDFGNSISETTVILPITELEDGKYDKNIHQKIYNNDLEFKVKNGLDKNPSKLKIADITTIDKSRLSTKIGKVSPKFMVIVETKLKKLLDFT